MSLRPLLEIANEDERLRALRSAVGGSGAAVDAYVSASLRPYLLAALIGGDDGATPGPTLIVAADDRSARDLAGDLKAFLAPRPVHIYPSRGTTFESHLDPPPHLAGLRIAAMNALADPSAGRGRQRDRAGREGARSLPAARDPALCTGARASTSRTSRCCSPMPATSGPTRSRSGASSRCAAGSSTSTPPPRSRRSAIDLFGDEIESMRRFSVFTQRSLGEAERVELAPAAELSAEHRGEVDADNFLARPRPDPGEALVVIAAAEEIPGALHDYWEDVTAASRRGGRPSASTRRRRAAAGPRARSRSARTPARSTPSERSGPSFPRAPSPRRRASSRS